MNALFEKIQDEELDAVRDMLIDEPQLVNITDDSVTPLFLACQLGKCEIARLLLEAGANPNHTQSDGETALHVAVFEKEERCVDLLLAHGADPNVATDEGKTPLMNSAQAGLSRPVSLLLRHGAQPDAKDRAGRTALHWAMLGEHDNDEIANILLDAGSHREVKNDNGDSALDYAQAMKKHALEQKLRVATSGRQ